MNAIPQEEINGLKNQILAWEKADGFLQSAQGQWFEQTILGTLHDEAVELLSRAKTEEDRMLAQQTLLASRKPRQLIDRLISQGRAAEQALLSLPTQQKDENHE